MESNFNQHHPTSCNIVQNDMVAKPMQHFGFSNIGRCCILLPFGRVFTNVVRKQICNTTAPKTTLWEAKAKPACQRMHGFLLRFGWFTKRNYFLLFYLHDSNVSGVFYRVSGARRLAFRCCSTPILTCGMNVWSNLIRERRVHKEHCFVTSSKTLFMKNCGFLYKTSRAFALFTKCLVIIVLQFTRR